MKFLAKVDWEAVTVIGALTGIFMMVIWVLSRDARKEYQCQKICGVYKSRMIEDKCHCATEKGWELAK